MIFSASYETAFDSKTYEELPGTVHVLLNGVSILSLTPNSSPVQYSHDRLENEMNLVIETVTDFFTAVKVVVNAQEQESGNGK
jgi:hypothetical protein